VHSPAPIIRPAVIRVQYLSDKVIGREDRNLQIDKIMVDGVTFETEAPSVFTVGTWKKQTRCDGGNKYQSGCIVLGMQNFKSHKVKSF